MTTRSDFPSEAMLWIKDVEMVDSLEELKSSRSVSGNNFTNFEMLDAKIAFLRGRQIACMIYDFFRVTGAHDTLFDYADLFSVALHDDNIQEFDPRWDEVLLPMSKIPSDDILESLYKLRIRESAQLKTILDLYDMEIHQKISMPNYRNIEDNGEEEYRSETSITNFDATHGRIETGAVGKNRKGMSGVEGGKGTWYQWKEKVQCSKGDQCSFRRRVTIMHKNRHRKPPHLLSHQ